MSEISLRKSGRTGRITLTRPASLNALTWGMIRQISAVLPDWAADPDIDMLIIDATGDKAFCAGGDLGDLYESLSAGDADTPRRFWREEYAMNAALFHFPKPVAAFLHGFTMGGGVGLGCHASHRIVCESSRIALPECSIGLVPDVGASLLLARAPGRLGEYLAVTARRADPGTAIHAGLADYHIARDAWPDLIAALEDTGDWTAIDRAASDAPQADLADHLPAIDALFAGETLRDIWTLLETETSDFAEDTRTRMAKNAPLAMASAIELIHRARTRDRIEAALAGEYRFVYRIAEQGDFREGIRAAIIDRDKAPKWQHESPDAPTLAEVSRMLAPLGENELKLET